MVRERRYGFSLVEVLITAFILVVIGFIFRWETTSSPRANSVAFGAKITKPVSDEEIKTLLNRDLLKYHDGTFSLVIFCRASGSCLIIDAPDSPAADMSVYDVAWWLKSLARIIRPNDPDYSEAAKKFLLQIKSEN